MRGTEFSLFFPFKYAMLTSHHVELKSHTKANHEEMLNISKSPQRCARNDTVTAQNCWRPKLKQRCYCNFWVLNAAVFCLFFHVGVGIQVRGFGGLSETMISVGSVISLAPSQAVLNCSGTGNSLWKKAIRARLFKPRLCKLTDG